MRYKILVLITGILLLSPIVASALPSCELIDGDFENWSGDTLLDWEYNADGETLERVPGLTGSCPKFTMKYSENPSLVAFLGDVSGGLLDFSVYINGNDTNSEIVLYINLGHDDGSIIPSVVGTLEVTPFTWTKAEATGIFIPSSAINASIKLSCTYLGSDATHIMYIDECEAFGTAINEFSNTQVLILSSFILANVIGIRIIRKQNQ